MKDWLKLYYGKDKPSLKTIIGRFYLRHVRASEDALYLIRKANYLYENKKKFRLLVVQKKLVKRYGIFVGKTKIGENLSIPHPNGIVIGAISIGDNCKIYQQVTIGSAHIGDFLDGKQPRIGNNCVLFSGCKIIGDITLADGTIVGANAVLNTDTVENGVYVGAPARLVKRNK